VDELLAPPRINAVMDELRESRELPAVLTALESEDPQKALDLILEEIPGSSAEQRERLRELAVAVFDHLGHEDPVTIAYRRRLASALY
jgi:thioredoxin-like negative regulator of GroEL